VSKVSGGKSLELDRRIPDVGRIKRRSGTSSARVFRRLNDMITDLHEAGRLDVLRAIRDQLVTPLAVYDGFRIHGVKLPSAESTQPLKETMEAWYADYPCSDRHRQGFQQTLRYLLALPVRGKTAHDVGDIPALLERLRVQMNKDGRASSFNKARVHCLAFLRSTLKRHHPLWVAVSAVEMLPVSPEGRGIARTVGEVKRAAQIANTRDAGYGTLFLAMALTGMGPKEAHAAWEVLTDRVAIHGTKREGRDRIVPLVLPALYAGQLPAITIGYDRFYHRLRDALSGSVLPYDARRSFAHWMEEAGIPRTRRKLYMGHAGTDSLDRYERHEITQFLAADAARLTTYIEANMTPATTETGRAA
jgi:hypothetical protein